MFGFGVGGGDGEGGGGEEGEEEGLEEFHFGGGVGEFVDWLMGFGLGLWVVEVKWIGA